MPRNGEQKFDVRAFLRTIGEGITSVDWSKGKTVFAQGDPADALFYIQNGKVKVTYTNSTGKLALLGPGGTLHAWAVSGCLGLINDGDPAQASGSLTVSPTQTITSP